MADLPRYTIGSRADLPDMPEIAAELTEQTASCTLPTGEKITVSHRVPLYTLARELAAKGYGDYRLQAYTPTGTPSLRGLVSVMAGLMVTERDKEGLRLEKYRPFDRRGGLVQRDEGSEAILGPPAGDARQ